MTLSGACADVPSTVESGEEEQVGTAEQGVTCVTVQNTGPITTMVDDTQIVIDPTDPTRENTNYGATQQMNTGYVGTGYQRILLKFDLNGAGIPQDSIVSSATLTLRMIQSIGKQPISLYAASGMWGEFTATWNSVAALPNGGLGAFQTSLATLGVPNNSNISISLANSLVESWTNAATNYGLVIDHVDAGRTAIGGSEAPSTGPRPKLLVCYDPPSCTDGIQNQGEGGVDCGGPCPLGCGPCAGQPDGTACDDGDACTPMDTCQGGLCVGRSDPNDANTCGAGSMYMVDPGGPQVNVSGQIDMDGDDYFSFHFNSIPAPGGYYHPMIWLSDDAGGQYTLYIEQACGAGYECGTNLSTFEMSYPFNPNDCLVYGNCTDNTPKPAHWEVRVAPTASAPVCSMYTVSASNM
jgi:hypothetical protein